MTNLFDRTVAFRNTGGSWPTEFVSSTFVLECVLESGEDGQFVFFENVEVAHSNQHRFPPLSPISKMFGWLKSPCCPLKNAPGFSSVAITVHELLPEM